MARWSSFNALVGAKASAGHLGFLLRRPGEQQQIAVRVLDDEGMGAPRLKPQFLMQWRAGAFDLAKQRPDAVDAVQSDDSGQQIFAFAQALVERRRIDVTQIEPRLV